MHPIKSAFERANSRTYREEVRQLPNQSSRTSRAASILPAQPMVYNFFKEATRPAASARRAMTKGGTAQITNYVGAPQRAKHEWYWPCILAVLFSVGAWSQTQLATVLGTVT